MSSAISREIAGNADRKDHDIEAVVARDWCWHACVLQASVEHVDDVRIRKHARGIGGVVYFAVDHRARSDAAILAEAHHIVPGHDAGDRGFVIVARR